MSPADPRITTIFSRALELDGAERESFIERECAGDASGARDVRELLRHHDSAGTDPFWQSSAIEHERAAPDPSLGQFVGPYRIEALIGKGGMGRVYRAVRADAAFEKHVAIKLINRGMDADAIVARFRAERQILANLEHLNIARLIDGGTDAHGLPYLVMEYVEGQPPTTYLTVQPNVDMRARVQLFRQICAAVHYAHQRMVIHRDLKPANLLVEANGTPKLLDFGIAKLLDPSGHGQFATVIGERVLTPAYASPEQIRGELATTASDLYSLGVIFHEMLTGSLPPAGNDLGRMRWLERPSRARDLENIVFMTLRQDPALRYSSVAQLSEDLDRYLDGLPVVARGHSLPYVAARFLQRHKATAAAIVLIAVTLVGGIITTRAAQQRAERRFRELQGLAHSVVFDYSDAIRGLAGSTPVQQRLVKDALTYLDGLAKDAAGDVSLRRDLVGAYSKISQVLGDPYHDNLGDTTAALITAKKATSMGEQLVKDDPKVDNIMALADAYDTQSNVLSSTADLSAIGDVTLRALALYQQVSKLQPNDVEARLLVSQTYWALGDLYGAPGISNLGHSRQALEYYQRALATAREAETMQSPVEDNTRMRVFWSLDSLGLMELSLGHATEAHRYGSEALERVTTLSTAKPTSMRFLSAASLALDHLGRQLVGAGRIDDALKSFRAAEAKARAASQSDPKNVSYRRKLAIVMGYLSLALRTHGDVNEAVAAAEEALAIMKGLSAGDPANADFLSDVSLALRRLAEAHSDAQHHAVALRHATESVDRYQGAPAKDDSFVTLSAARAWLAKGHAEMALKRTVDAVASFLQAHDLLAPLHKRDADSAMIATEFARSGSRLAAALTAAGQTQQAATISVEARAVWADLKQKGTLLPQDAAEAK